MLKDRLAAAFRLANAEEFTELEEAARSILQDAPGEPNAHNLLGIALMRTGRQELAVASFTAANRLAPSAYAYARNLARTLTNLRRFDEARELRRRFTAVGGEQAAELSAFVARNTGETTATAKDVFDEIYRNNAWTAGSGLGSSTEKTAVYRAFLADFLKANRIRSVVDLGCGDGQIARLIDWTGIKYLGLDVSEFAIDRARDVAPPSCEFRAYDAFTEQLPNADLLIVKDVLQHWPNGSIGEFLAQSQHFRYSLFTNGYADTSRLNTDISLGNYRPLDLSAAPFQVRGANVLAFQADETKMTFLRLSAD